MSPTHKGRKEEKKTVDVRPPTGERRRKDAEWRKKRRGKEESSRRPTLPQLKENRLADLEDGRSISKGRKKGEKARFRTSCGKREGEKKKAYEPFVRRRAELKKREGRGS